MHKTIRDSIGHYSDQEISEDDRLDILKDLALVLHPEAAAFFVTALSTLQEGRLLLEVLGVLEAVDVNEEPTYLALGEQILRIIATAKDNLTIIYAVKAAVNFPDVPRMIDALLSVLLDTSAPSDARLPVFLFLKRTGESAPARAVLEQLLSDPEFSDAASRLLKVWGG